MTEVRIDQTSYDALAAVSREDDIFAIFSHDPDEGMGQIREALSGRHDSIRASLLERLGKEGQILPLTILEAQLLAHAGIDPIAVAAAMIHSDQLLLLLPDQDDEDDAGCFAYIDRTYIRQGHITIGPGVHWRMSGDVEACLPETLRSSVCGGALSEIVSHPVLDAHRLRVEDVEDAGTQIRLVTNAPQEPLSLAELALHRPAP